MTAQHKGLICFLTAIFWLPAAAHAAINCTITTVAVAFGAYNVYSSTPLTSAGSVTITCRGIGVGTDPVSVSLSAGNSGSFQPRRMLRGLETLTYNLYLDAAHTQVWGDGTGGTQRFASVSNNRALNLAVFGHIPPGQDVSVGTYSDTIIATINF
ncbi:MAG TPA: spore coat U domain-containing protein [Nitrospira sp.]|nr:spore coat U domain-containing protein [Nitrospira sp.]